jgi:hypothetical protein
MIQQVCRSAICNDYGQGISRLADAPPECPVNDQGCGGLAGAGCGGGC